MSSCITCPPLICTNPDDNDLYSLQNGSEIKNVSEMPVCPSCPELICTNPVDNDLYSLQNGMVKLNPPFEFWWKGKKVPIPPIVYTPGYPVYVSCCDFWTESFTPLAGWTTEQFNNAYMELWVKCANEHPDCLGGWPAPVPTPPEPPTECPPLPLIPFIGGFRSYGPAAPNIFYGGYDSTRRLWFIPDEQSFPVDSHILFIVSTETNRLVDIVPEPFGLGFNGSLWAVACPDIDYVFMLDQNRGWVLFIASSRVYDARVAYTTVPGITQVGPYGNACYDRSRHRVYVNDINLANSYIAGMYVVNHVFDAFTLYNGHRFGWITFDTVKDRLLLANRDAGVGNPCWYEYDPDNVATLTNAPTLKQNINERTTGIFYLEGLDVVVFDYTNSPGPGAGIRFVNPNNGVVLNDDSTNMLNPIVGAVYDDCQDCIYLTDGSNVAKYNANTFLFVSKQNAGGASRHGLCHDPHTTYTYVINALLDQVDVLDPSSF